MVYTVTVNPAIDCLMHLGSPLIPGALNRAAREEYRFGGKGINVSLVLHRLGVPTAALGFAAGFTGRALIRGLQEQGLDARFLPASGGMTRINVKISAHEETEINGAGPVITQADLLSLAASLEDAREGDFLVLSGSVPANLGEDAYARILARLDGRDLRVVVDASGALLTNTLRFRPFLIKPNRRELEEICGRALPSDGDVTACARVLQVRGARNVLVSLGADGGLLLTESGTVCRMRAPEGAAVSTVGAGDSMVAGFLWGYLQTGDPLRALKAGITAGSATAFRTGLASREEILSLLNAL